MRKIKAVIFDLDGTLTPVHSVWQYIHERLGTWENQGLKSLQAFLAGEITYQQFAARDVWAWRGVARSTLESIVSEISLRPGARQTANELKGAGLRMAILSSGLDLLANPVAERLSMDLCLANGLGFTDDVLDGSVQIRVPWHGKPDQLPLICRTLDVEPGEIAVVGDGVGDAPLFPMVGLGVAFNATPDVEALADVSIRNADIRTLIPFLLGAEYNREEKVG
ncbi:MAG: HAD family hydrolase [Desulforudis sp.]|nr:HAD family phosphatase [Clostridia bacterium]MDQ7791069.1 HAD family phosphatase [Clostridia bacterium]RJX17880.1 MAG: HAD family hydrolase [Desulforudis sp.]